jgi:penicillin-binding protein 2
MNSVVKREGKWSDIRTVYASIGQDTVVVTPISMLRVIGSVAMRGKEYIPHFLKEFKPIAAMGEEGDSTYFPARAGFAFQHPEPRIIEMGEKEWDIIHKGMWGVVNNGGTAASIKMPNLEIAGKTGTAQVASLGKDVGHNKDHAWFDSFAPWDKPEITVVALIENSGFGAANAGPAARGIYEAWLAKRPGGAPPIDKEVARR